MIFLNTSSFNSRILALMTFNLSISLNKMNFIPNLIISYAIIAVTLINAQNCQPPSLGEWHFFNDNNQQIFYSLSTEKISEPLQNYIKSCKNLDKNVEPATILSQKANDFIVDEILKEDANDKQEDENVWIGGLFYPNDRDWHWFTHFMPFDDDTGKNSTYFTNWAENQPELGEEQGADLVAINSKTGLWSPFFGISSNLRYLCEYKCPEKPLFESEPNKWYQTCRNSSDSNIIGYVDNLTPNYFLEFNFKMQQLNSNPIALPLQLGDYYYNYNPGERLWIPYIFIMSYYLRIDFDQGYHYSGTLDSTYLHAYLDVNLQPTMENTSDFYTLKIEILNNRAVIFLNYKLLAVTFFDGENGYDNCYQPEPGTDYPLCRRKGIYKPSDYMNVPIFAGDQFDEGRCYDSFVGDMVIRSIE